jgi:GNAT superfamily N-acetyltransferase
MAQDVPTGEIDFTPHVVDEARLRTSETRLSAGWISIVAAARRRADGVMGGYSMLVLPRGGELAMQDDTLVMPEHRGHRLGTRLKLATLQVLTRDHPERRALHTWTEPDNHAMYRTNTDFGYVARERMHELQRKT